VGSLAFGVQSMAVEESMGVNKSENSIVVGAKVNKCGGAINLSLKL